MKTTKKLAVGLLLIFWASASASAQDRTDAGQSAPASTVTISASEHGVRYAAFGSVRQVRLEVFNANGESLYNSGFRAGSVSDWALEDGRRQRLPDGAYLCVVTVRELSGRLSVKQGSVVIQGAQVSLQLGEAAQAVSAETDKRLTPVSDGPAAAVTLTAHDGSDGQVVSTHGSLTFRAGDFFAGRDRELMRVTPEGRVGVGTANPQATLDVAGSVRAQDGIVFGDGTVLKSARNLRNTEIVGVTSDATVGAPTLNASGSGTAGRISKWVDNSGTLGDSVITESNGRIGIGTASPASLLHLSGPGGAAALTFDTPGTRRFRLQTVPSVPNWGALTLNANYNAGWNLDDTSTNGWFFKLDTIGGNGANDSNGLWLWRVPNGANPHTNEYPVFGVTNGQAYFAGNVGIGTLNPQVPLHVAGDMKVTGNAVVDGNIAAKYQDVAEWVPASEEMRAGTVVTLDVTRTNTVEPSSRAYDTRVAGVVSAQPGLTLGQGGAGKVLVATTGRVKVRVDATRRPIRVGDLLVTSGRPGVAMRSVPVTAGLTRIHRPGTIIGKALEPLAGGEGEILVLLSLQ